MRITNILAAIDNFAPPQYQEDYDNSGLICGDANTECTGALLSLDCTEQVVEEAISNNCNLIVCHHPIVFSGLKRLTGATYVERTVILAIRHNIAIYACHTNLDNVKAGVNQTICNKLGLINTRTLDPKKGTLKKLITYVPASHHQQVLDAIFNAGAGQIGNYDSCSFNTEGKGTFRGNEKTRPFLGEAGKLSTEAEIKIETVFESGKERTVLNAFLAAHPYEEVAYDIYALENRHPGIGSGMTGEFEVPLKEEEFLKKVKSTFGTPVLKHTQKTGKLIKKVAVCGGSGQFLLKKAIQAGADAYITADFKYHEYFDADGKLLLVDTGHFESEQFTPEIFYEIIKKNFPTFAIRLSKINTNPINYF